jgi:hypothetical protein
MCVQFAILLRRGFASQIVSSVPRHAGPRLAESELVCRIRDVTGMLSLELFSGTVWNLIPLLSPHVTCTKKRKQQEEKACMATHLLY